MKPFMMPIVAVRTAAPAATGSDDPRPQANAGCAAGEPRVGTLVVRNNSREGN